MGGMGRWGLGWLDRLSEGGDAQGLGWKPAAGPVSPAGSPSPVPALRMLSMLVVLLILFIFLLAVLLIICYCIFREE